MDLKGLFRRGRAQQEPAAQPKEPASERALREMIAEQPDVAPLRARLGGIFERRGNTARAAQSYLEAAGVFLGNDQHEQALRLLEKVQRLDPGREEIAARRERLAAIPATLSRRDSQIARLAQRKRAAADPDGITAGELRRLWNELGATPFVTALDDDALELFFGSVEVQQWTAHTTIVRKGQHLPRCYLLAEGQVDAVVAGRDWQPLALRRFVPGDLLGDRALLDHAPWPMSFRTVGPSTTALRLTRGRWDGLVDGSAGAGTLTRVLRAQGRDGELAEEG